MATAKPFWNQGTAVATNGSKFVVGTGTAWNGRIRQYDRFVGLDGKEGVVDIVVDDTHITLLENWPGATQASLTYKIWMSPDEIFLQTQSRDIFATLQASMLTAFAAIAPVANRLFYLDGSNSPALSAITTAALTVLDDTTTAAMLETIAASTRLGLNGIAPPSGNLNLAIIPGFYLAISSTTNQPVPGSFANVFVMQSSSIVSQFAHIDTASSSVGAFYARGSNDGGATWSSWRSIFPVTGNNANGRFMQFPDGTMISWSSISWTTAINTAFGSIFISPSVVSVTFPSTYVSPPRFFAGASTNTAARAWFYPYGTGAAITAACAVTQASAAYTVDWFAIGRWF